VTEFWTNGAGLPQAFVRRAQRAEAAGFDGITIARTSASAVEHAGPVSGVVGQLHHRSGPAPGGLSACGSHAMSLVPSGVAERFTDVNGVQLRLITGGLR
jgi:hypothetical protein